MVFCILFRLPGVVVVANSVSEREGQGWGELGEWVKRGDWFGSRAEVCCTVPGCSLCVLGSSEWEDRRQGNDRNVG